MMSAAFAWNRQRRAELLGGSDVLLGVLMLAVVAVVALAGRKRPARDQSGR